MDDTTAPPDDDPLGPVVAAVGPRLRALRQHRETTLAQLAAAGISVSTLSRLESGQRRPTLDLLLLLARAHQVALDDLVGAPPTGDPRVPVLRAPAGGRFHSTASEQMKKASAEMGWPCPGVPRSRSGRSTPGR